MVDQLKFDEAFTPPARKQDDDSVMCSGVPAIIRRTRVSIMADQRLGKLGESKNQKSNMKGGVSERPEWVQTLIKKVTHGYACALWLEPSVFFKKTLENHSWMDRGWRSVRLCTGIARYTCRE